MTEKKYILAIDQGTTSTKTLLVDGQGRVVARGSEALVTSYLDNGFVEQDAEDIFRNVMTAVKKCIEVFLQNGGDIKNIATCGISNQRETFVLWDKTGRPLQPAIVWQCKRSIAICEELKEKQLQQIINEKTGLVIDPYFSATKLIWLYRNDEKIRAAIERGEVYFGTIDTWLLFKLTNGEKYLTDHTNASRTLFFNLAELGWDRELLQLFGLSSINLPSVKPSAFLYGETNFNGLFPHPVSIAGMIGDSHAAAFGEGCFAAGTAKATLGTGCSVLMNTGGEIKRLKKGMVTTICWSTEQRVDYALEGVIVSCGSTIEWLKNELGLFSDSRETEAMAIAAGNNNGVYLIPAFSGLGAPHWKMNSKASLSGMTFDCNKDHIVRAALESIAYQARDVLMAMEKDTGTSLQELMVDGGMTANRFLLQFLADVLETKVIHIGMPDVSALGAAWLAGLKAGIYQDLDQLRSFRQDITAIHPREDLASTRLDYAGWQEAIRKHA